MAHTLVDSSEAVEYGLFSRHQARQAGFPVEEIELRIRRGRWQRCGRGVLRVAERAEQPGDAVLLAVLRAGPSAVAAGRTAASVWQWDALRPSLVVTVSVPRGHGTAGRECRKGKIIRVPGVRREDLRPDEMTAVGVLPVTTPLRTAVDLLVGEPLLDAVVGVDSGLRRRDVTLDAVRSGVDDRPRLANRRQTETVVELLDPGSGSLPESVARVLFAGCDIPMPQTQYAVIAGGRFLGRADFAWPEVWLIVEIEGFAYHSAPDAFQHDHDRFNEFTKAGWRYLRFTAADVTDRPAYVLSTIRETVGW
ncbi:MAG: hypothetical protein QOC98_370 [Frankiaceae bacterium]|nr:hypothetical protein [Frankiaceae bacterium]